jgi:hypothetical protein
MTSIGFAGVSGLERTGFPFNFVCRSVEILGEAGSAAEEGGKSIDTPWGRA